MTEPTASPSESGGSNLRFWPLTDVGRVRDHNEDAFLVNKKLNLFVVCDGMGGHAAGEVASNLAARTVSDALGAERDALVEFEQGHGGTTRKDVLRLLEASVQQACSKVYQTGQVDETKRGMGTTLDSLLVIGSRGFIAHVGDSRIYLYRQGAVHQLTEDHSLINELLKRGRLTRAQIEKVQYKNAVTRAVGVYESVDIDVFDFDVLPGDRFLLCSDGLHGYLDESELAGIFDQIPDEEMPKHLIDLANERGGKDNITALLVRVPDAEAGVDVLTREVNLKLEVLHKMPLFRFVAFPELVRILNITTVVPYVAGETVVSEGEEGDELFVVLTGKVRVHSGETTLVELGPGQHFGEMALIDKAPRSASVTAAVESKLLTIKRRDFFDMVRKDHDVAVKLLWSFLGVLTQRLRSTSRELGEAKEALNAEELTAELLLGDDEGSSVITEELATESSDVLLHASRSDIPAATPAAKPPSVPAPVPAPVVEAPAGQEADDEEWDEDFPTIIDGRSADDD